MAFPSREIRAHYDADSLVAYQAFNERIARAAVENGRFVAPFDPDRMTWIKPSFCWMMYRSGWATKPGQEHVLAIRITRTGFEWALEHSCLSTFQSPPYDTREQWLERKNRTPVRIQWDPERDIDLARLERRSIQIGLRGEAVRAYIEDWILAIEDITGSVRDLAASRDPERLPVERPYPLRDDLARIIAATATPPR